jgi:hypothetical protein
VTCARLARKPLASCAMSELTSHLARTCAAIIITVINQLKFFVGIKAPVLPYPYQTIEVSSDAARPRP